MPIKEIPAEVKLAKVEYWPETEFESPHPLVWATPGNNDRWDVCLAESVCVAYNLPNQMDGLLMSSSKYHVKTWVEGLGKLVERSYPLPSKRHDVH